MPGHSSPDSQSCLEMWRNATTTKRSAQRVVERERIENNKVRAEIEAARQCLARLQLALALADAEDEDEENELELISQNKSASAMETGFGNSVSFSAGSHPEARDPIRRGTPAFLPVIDYDADDESEEDYGSPSGVPLPRLTPTPEPSDVFMPCLAPTPGLSDVSCLTPTPELLQSPEYSLRALNPSEVWDEEAPVEPILYAPVPQRPFIEPELLLLNYHEKPDGADNTSGTAISPDVVRQERLDRILGLVSDIKRVYNDLETLLRNR